MKKVIMTCLLMLGFIISGFSQSEEKMMEKAKEKVEELNAEIIEGDASLALSEAQKEKIYNLHLTKMQEAKKLKNAKVDKEKIKASNKVYNQQIFKDVLTKEQKKARRKAGKDDDEDDDGK